MRKQTSTIDSIIKNYSPEQVTAPALKAAIEQRKKQQEEAAAAKLLDDLDTIDRIMENEVNSLRMLRKKEEAQRKRVLAVNAAKEQFLKDGNWSNFADTFNKI